MAGLVSTPQQPYSYSRLIGPVLATSPAATRYAAAFLVIAVVAVVREALVPVVGIQAPLLPFGLAVFAAALLGGFGPAVFATAAASVIATVLYADFSDGGELIAWSGHVTLFVLLGCLVALLTHRLQVAYRAQAENLAAATAAEKRLRTITDAVPALIAYVDSSNRYVFSNRTYCEWFGLQPEQLCGAHARDVLGEQAYEAAKPRIELALSGHAVDFEAEVPQPGGGEIRHVRAHYVPDRADDGSIRGYFALVIDITERKALEEALRESVRQKDQYMAMLAHELRNPLAPISSIAHLLTDERTDIQTLRQYGGMVQRQVNTLARLVNDLLDAARLTRGSIEIKFERVDLSTVLQHAAETVRPMFDAKQQTINVADVGAPVAVQGDPVRLEQALVNLLTNASKFSPPQSQVHVAVTVSGEKIVVSVRDYGNGIDPELLPNLFGLFVQGEQGLHRPHGGLGIGLSLVKGIVEQHGGTVSAHSAGPGLGSEFQITLPCTGLAPAVDA